MFSFGEELRRERERRGLDLGQIAQKTNITRRLLEAIESGRLDEIPGSFYQRAYLRAYARQVGMDPDQVIASYELALSTDERTRAERSSPTSGVTLAAAFKWVALGTIGLGLTGAAAAVWQRAPEPTSPPNLSVYPSGGSPARQESLVPSPPFVPLVEGGFDSVGTTTPAVRLVLKVNEPCWLEVSTDGKRVTEGIMLRGFEKEFRGKEVCFSLGNAGGVSYWVDGRPGKPLGQPGQVLKDVCVRSNNASDFVGTPPDGLGRR